VLLKNVNVISVMLANNYIVIVNVFLSYIFENLLKFERCIENKRLKFLC